MRLRIWNIVEAKYPKAQLNIIGTGSLYNAKAQLGPLGIAEKSLEKQMAKFICDHTGKIKENIHFLGILGEEKYDVFQRCAV